VSTLTIRQARERDEARWNGFVLAHPEAEKYHLYGWRRVIVKSFGHPTHYLLAETGGETRGVLPLAQIKSRLFGHFLVSLPFFNYGGVLAADTEAEKALFHRAVELARELGAQHLEVRHLAPLAWFSANGAGGHYFTRRHKVSLRLALPGSAEALWNSLRSKLRSQVRKPLKEGCTAAVGGAELVGEFYRVFAQNMRDLGTPVYSRRLFESVLAEFPGAARIGVVRHQGQPIAAGLVMGFRDILEVPWASSLRAHSRLAPNMLLYWSLLEFACQAGYRRFDFGRSSPESPACRFKEQWGAQPVALSWHYWSAEGRVADLSPGNSRFGLAIALWRRLPLGLANSLGPGIVKYLP
jgi:FemAB-related protein (PEP-CTERM system-associated)